MHKTKIDTCVHTYKSHYKDGGEVFIDYDYANNTQVIVLPNGSKEQINNEELACVLEELKKEKTPKGYNLALINFAIAEVKDKKMKGGILETPELDGNFYYIGFFDKKNHQLKSTARITQADVNSTKYRDVVFNAIDKGLYIKFIDKSYYTNFSPLDKPITEQEIYKPGGQIPNHMNITQEAIAKGAKHELEHAATIQKIKDNPGMSKEEAARLIALDHLKEDPNYYEQPHFNEGGEMANGGSIYHSSKLNEFEKDINALYNKYFPTIKQHPDHESILLHSNQLNKFQNSVIELYIKYFGEPSADSHANKEILYKNINRYVAEPANSFVIENVSRYVDILPDNEMAEGGSIHDKVTTKYYKVEYKSLTDFKKFLSEVAPFTTELRVFFAGIGDAYMIIKGYYDDSPYSSDKDDFHSIISKHFGFNYQTLNSRPSPEKRWDGKWLTYDESMKFLENFEQGGTTHAAAPSSPSVVSAPAKPKYAPFQILTDNTEEHVTHSKMHNDKRSYYIVLKPATEEKIYNPKSGLEEFAGYKYYVAGSLGSPSGEALGSFSVSENKVVPYYSTADELTGIIDKYLRYQKSPFPGNKEEHAAIIKYMQDYRQKIEAGYSIYNDPEITTIIISSAAPLWTQLTALLGRNQADFDQVITAQRNNWSQPLIQQNTGEKFAVITLEDAKKAGILGMQIPSEGAVHNFFEMVKEEGEHATIAHYKEKFLLTDEVISNLLNGYATGATYKQEYELLKNIAQKFYRIKHPKKYAQGGDMKEQIKETRLDDNTLLEEKGDTKVLTIRSGMYKGIYTITADGEVSDEDGPVKEKIKEYIMSKIENMPAPGEKPVLTGKAVITSWQAVPDAWKVVKKIPKVPYTNSPFDKGLQTILEPFVGTDELRPAMTSFNFDENGITATDAHKMLILPYPNKKFNGAYCVTKLCKQANSSVKKDKLQGKYTDYAAVISKENPIVHKVSVYKLKTFVKAILMGKYANEVKHQIRLVYNKEQGAYDHIGFNGEFLIEVLDTFLKLGYEHVFMSFSMPNRAVILSPVQAAAKKPYEHVGKEILAILMPIMIDGNYGSYRGGYHAEGESVSPHMQSAAMDLDWGKEFAVSYNLIDDEIYNHDGTIAPFDYNLTTAVNKDMTDLQETILRAYLPKNPKVLVTEYVKVDGSQLTATDETATIQLNIASKPKGLYSFLAGALDFLPESPEEATFRNASIADFPEVGYGKTRGFKNIGTINRAEFVFHLQKAVLNLGKDDFSPALKGLHFVKTKDALIIEASNSNTLYHAVINNEDIKPCDFIISEPAKLLVFLKNTADTSISVSVSGTEVSFVAEAGVATHKFIDATFPNLTAKVNLTKKLSIDIGELKECLKTITKEEANPPVLVFNHISEETATKMDVDLYNGFHFDKGQPSHVRHLCKVSANYEAVESKLSATYFLGMPFTAGDKTKTYFGLSKQVIETFIKTSESDILNLHFNEYNQAIVLTDTDIEYAEEVINAPKTKKAKKSAPVMQETAPVKPKAEVNTERKALETLLSLTTNAHEKELIEAEIKKHTA